MFWFFDTLKGGSVSRHYKEIESVLQDFHSNESKRVRTNRLKEIINHALTTSEFYKDFNSNSELADLPVINKGILRENFITIQSSTVASSHEARTSGSTGTPFAILQDKNKRNRNTADTLYFATKAGFKLGSQLVFVRVWGGQNKNKFVAWLQNIVKHDIQWINRNPKRILDYLENNRQSKGIVAHASALETISKYIERNNLNLNIKNLNSVIGISEPLSIYTREKLSEQLGVPVVSRYSNVENGIIAQQSTSGDNHFEINWASYYVEVLKFNEDTPVEKGKLGRIVITDLFNYCVPLLRYDTGDIGMMTLDNKGVPVFKSVEGRKLDLVFNTNGDVLPSLLIGTIMKKYRGIRQFQFIQEEKTRYILKLNVDEAYKDETKILKEFIQVLGEDSTMNIVYTKEIPLLSSGKRRYVVNNYLKKQQKEQKKLWSNGT